MKKLIMMFAVMALITIPVTASAHENEVVKAEYESKITKLQVEKTMLIAKRQVCEAEIDQVKRSCASGIDSAYSQGQNKVYEDIMKNNIIPMQGGNAFDARLLNGTEVKIVVGGSYSKLTEFKKMRVENQIRDALNKINF